MRILQLLQSQLSEITDTKTRKLLKETPFLPVTNSSLPRRCVASDCYVIDTVAYKDKINPPSAPSTLHLLYHTLGSRLLSQSVQVSTTSLYESEYVKQITSLGPL